MADAARCPVRQRQRQQPKEGSQRGGYRVMRNTRATGHWARIHPLGVSHCPDRCCRANWILITRVVAKHDTSTAAAAGIAGRESPTTPLAVTAAADQFLLPHGISPAVDVSLCHQSHCKATAQGQGHRTHLRSMHAPAETQKADDGDGCVCPTCISLQRLEGAMCCAQSCSSTQARSHH